MKLFIAGSFGGINLRRQLYASGAKYVLSSAAWPNARETAEIIAKGEEVKLFLAALGNGNDTWAMARSGGAKEILCSFGHGTSRMTADHFAPRNRQEDRMKLFIAGELTPKLIEDICQDTGEHNLLCTNASKGSRDRADYFTSSEQQVKLFIAGNRGSKEIQEAEFEETGTRNLLFANGADQGMEMAENFATKVASDFTPYHLLIDSGAFTAFKQGTPIVLADYIAYAKEMQAKAYCEIEFIGLDVITPTGSPEEVLEQNCQQGYDNWKEMCAAGVPCIPTFHRGDDFKWLDIFARELPAGSRFCIAPKVDGTRKDVKMRWLNHVFQRLEELNGELNAAQGTTHKLWERWLIHGLGISSQEIMEAYPWYSVDSTGWLSAAQTCDLRFFDRKTKKIICLSSSTDYKEPGVEAELSKLAAEKYRVAKNHKYVPTIFDICQKCGAPEEGHKEAQQENEGLEAGAYWFGKEAIRADVHLAEHVTKVWQARGVFFPGEERLDTTGFPTGDHWQAYREGEQDGVKSHPDHLQFNWAAEEQS